MTITNGHDNHCIDDYGGDRIKSRNPTSRMPIKVMMMMMMVVVVSVEMVILMIMMVIAESQKPRQRVSNADRKVFANPESFCKLENFCDKFIIA